MDIVENYINRFPYCSKCKYCHAICTEKRSGGTLCSVPPGHIGQQTSDSRKNTMHVFFPHITQRPPRNITQRLIFFLRICSLKDSKFARI